MSVGSEDSLTELPLPFDISSAVSRALRISSFSDSNNSGGAHLANIHGNQTVFSGEACPTDYCCMQELEYSMPPYFYQKPPPPVYPGQPGIICNQPGVQNINSSSQEQYYDFPDMSYGHPPYMGNRTQSCSFPSFYPDNEAYAPPAKKRRNTVQYCNLDHSPEYSVNNDHSNWPWLSQLENQSLWTKFDKIGTEMVVTKGGRRMFPHLEVSFQNLNPSSVYSLKLEIHPCDAKRYKFLKTEWVPTGRAEKKQTNSVYEHPDSPNTGSFWISKTISFKMVKLTNNKVPKFKDQIILNSMQKYQPIIRLTDEKHGGSKTFSYHETTFIAVTAYQNNVMTQMKIDHNPYARAFREGDQSGLFPEKKGGHYDRYRKSSSSSPSHYKRKKPNSSISSPDHTTSATSIDSGSEAFSEGSHLTILSDEASPLLVADKTTLMSSLSTGNSLSYWVDDNSLWNPNLIAPDPLMESTGSFSEPYLQQTTQVELVYDVSPIKDVLDGSDGFVQWDTHCAYILDNANDDDVFL